MERYIKELVEIYTSNTLKSKEELLAKLEKMFIPLKTAQSTRKELVET